MDIEDIKNKILQGDVLEVLKKIPDESIDLIITSPPYYGLRDYGVEGQIGLEETFEEYLEKMLKITAELKRVLKKTGQFWLNMGDCYGTGAGADKRPGIKQATNTGTVKKKPMPGFQKCLLMQPERLAIAMIDRQGWILRNKVKWAKQVYLRKEGRTVGSVMPTSVKDRFNESGEELYFFVKSKKYYSDLDAVRIPNQILEITGGLPWNPTKGGRIYKRKYDIDKRQKELENGGVVSSAKRIRGFFDEYGGKTNIHGKNLCSVWQINPEPHNFRRELGVDVDHFAIFPQALVEIPIRFGSPKNGIVLDPFSGAGTTAVVAKKLGRNYLGIELNPEYIKLSEVRLKMIQKPLF